jgi:hypothetical protein
MEQLIEPSWKFTAKSELSRNFMQFHQIRSPVRWAAISLADEPAKQMTRNWTARFMARDGRRRHLAIDAWCLHPGHPRIEQAVIAPGRAA